VWVAERKDLLCALFFLLTLLFYAKYADNKGGTAGACPGSLPLRTGIIVMRSFFSCLRSSASRWRFPARRPPADRLASFQEHTFIRSLLSAVAEKIPFIALSLFISLVIVAAHKEAEPS